MNLNELTAAQRAELKAQLAEQEKAEKAKRKADVEAYKKLVSETIDKSFEILRDQSNKLA